MEYAHIKYITDENTASIIFNRPASLNSINQLMGKEILAALSTIEDNKSIHAVLLTADGKAFCAGQDLKEVVTENEIKNPYEFVTGIYNPIVRKIRNMNKPIVCAVNGVAAGAGANIAFCCDVVTCSDNAYFVQAFSKIGLIPDSGGTFTLPRIVGLHRASAMMMLNDKIPAEEAFKIGLVYKIFSGQNLFRESLSIVKRLASMPMEAIGYIKYALDKSFSNDLESQLELEAILQKKAGETEEYKKRVKAFVQKQTI